ncbi:MAG: hypothetical protein NTW61_08800 [Candidatus Melainabacteria bacterium]|nr:hypothetical protein [Candidatus Melainabacteria bacterium]
MGTPTPPTNSGASPSKTVLNANPLCHKGIDGGMFFLPLRWTERIGSCRANAMVVPACWHTIQSLIWYELV